MRQALVNILLGVLAGSSILACKRSTSSEVQSLDEIGAGKLNGYQCRAPDSVRGQILSDATISKLIVLPNGDNCSRPDLDSNAKGLCDAVAGYVGQVPQELKINFFEKLGGNIKLIPEDQKLPCVDVFTDKNSVQYVEDSSLKQVTSCYEISGDKLVIFHKANLAAIADDGLRVFGMFYSQAPEHMRYDPVTKKTVVDPNLVDIEGYRDLKKDLAQLFLKDLMDGSKKPNASLSIDYMKNLLSPEEMQRVKDGNIESIKLVRVEDLKKGGPNNFASEYVRQQRLLDTVFGHAFDSQFCSDQTRTAASDFKPTLDFFNKSVKNGIFAAAHALVGNDKEAMSLVENDGDSLGLAGNVNFWTLLFGNNYGNGLNQRPVGWGPAGFTAPGAGNASYASSATAGNPFANYMNYSGGRINGLNGGNPYMSNPNSQNSRQPQIRQTPSFDSYAGLTPSRCNCKGGRCCGGCSSCQNGQSAASDSTPNCLDCTGGCSMCSQTLDS